MNERWICCQIGAREHYAVARALHASGKLDALITDAWRPNRLFMRLPGAAARKFTERFHRDLEEARVMAFNTALVPFELAQRLRRASRWRQILARNAWFEKQAVTALRKSFADSKPRTLFAYSYAARAIFHEAKSRGWRTILCQIDPGPLEEDIVRREHGQHPQIKTKWQPAPKIYWERWREECALADRVVVNSAWSRDALEKTGIEPEKIRVVPLACELDSPVNYPREYPREFSASRPLRALFLGQIGLRKGVAHLLEAARMMQNEPIEFQMVGPAEIIHIDAPANVRFFGAVARSEAARFYREADVFIFPTLSDGFGLTQLEAQSWRLPVIASRCCGEVVEDQKNGILLANVSAKAIVDALRRCLREPPMLAQFSQRAVAPQAFDLEKLQQRLAQLA